MFVGLWGAVMLPLHCSWHTQCLSSFEAMCARMLYMQKLCSWTCCCATGNFTCQTLATPRLALSAVHNPASLFSLCSISTRALPPIIGNCLLSVLAPLIGVHMYSCVLLYRCLNKGSRLYVAQLCTWRDDHLGCTTVPACGASVAMWYLSFIAMALLCTCVFAMRCKHAQASTKHYFETGSAFRV